jgi:hypothetical protein
MVIKRPRNDVGAFLTVLPRRVFIRVDGTGQSLEAFDWAAKHLLSPEIDEVFLLLCSKYGGRPAAGGWLGMGGEKRRSLQDLEAERIEIECFSDSFQDECIRKGLNSSKVRVESGSFEDMIRDAELKSCDMLVVGKDLRDRHREDAGLYAAHYAPFPVIVVGDTGESQHRTAIQACKASRPTSAPAQQSNMSQRPRHASSGGACTQQNKLQEPRPAGARSNSRRQRETVPTKGGRDCESGIITARGSDKELKCAQVPPPTLGPRSSSLERLLNTLAETDDDSVMRSRREQFDDDVDDHATPFRERALDTCFEHGSPSPPRPQSVPVGGSGMKRVATRCAIKEKNKEVELKSSSVSATPSPSISAGKDRDVPPHIDLGEPWMREPPPGMGMGAAAMLAS